MNPPPHPRTSARPVSEEITPAAPDRVGRVALESEDGTDGFEVWHAACRPVFLGLLDGLLKPGRRNDEGRLAGVFQLLTTSPDASRSVGSLAAMLGFSDTSYFYRAFKKRHGFTPGEAAGAAPPQEPPGTGRNEPPAASLAVATIHRWIWLMT